VQWDQQESEWRRPAGRRSNIHIPTHMTNGPRHLHALPANFPKIIPNHPPSHGEAGYDDGGLATTERSELSQAQRRAKIAKEHSAARAATNAW